ncbi:MAG: hypothetical protein MRJ96_01980 [Nitrospirales bacterium]|nr:hypothetical protein [Nitrospira sp.]MDR4500213.1 hypothetical protein [Nitrospirales bacterium]
MRKLGYFGAAIILAGSVSVAVAQERVPQHSGFGNGVGESQGSGTRSRVMDEDDMLRYLSAPETVQGEIVGVDYAGGKLFLDMGGSSNDERQLRGSLNLQTLYFDNGTNMESIKMVGKGDIVAISAIQETDANHKFSTGRKMVREVYVLEGSQLLGGQDNPNFGGGLGQRPDPVNSAALPATGGSYTGVPEGGIQMGAINTGVSTSVGKMTGAAPCWQCAPQPETVNGPTSNTIATDYGSDRKNFNKGTVQ